MDTFTVQCTFYIKSQVVRDLYNTSRISELNTLSESWGKKAWNVNKDQNTSIRDEETLQYTVQKLKDHWILHNSVHRLKYNHIHHVNEAEIW